MNIPGDWVLLKKISHHDIKPFIKECLDIKGSFKTWYLIISLASIVYLSALFTYGITKWLDSDSYSVILQFLNAFLFSVTLLIPIHELLHAIAYKIKGAHNIYFGGSLRKFMFYAASDGDILNGKEFRVVALAPFTIILIASLTLSVVFPDFTVFFLSVLAFHNLFCGGDFAMLNYMSQYPLESIFTFDVRSEKESYFYHSKSEN